MNDEHIQQLNHIDNKVDELEVRFDKHLDIYANNGKEAARLAAAVERLIERSVDRDKRTDEMYEWFQKITIGKSAIVWVVVSTFGIVTAIGTVVLMIKNILK